MKANSEGFKFLKLPHFESSSNTIDGHSYPSFKLLATQYQYEILRTISCSPESHQKKIVILLESDFKAYLLFII